MPKKCPLAVLDECVLKHAEACNQGISDDEFESVVRHAIKEASAIMKANGKI